MKPNNTFALIAHARGAANEYLTRELKNRGIEGIVPTHGNILAALTLNGPMTMKALAEKIRRNKSTVTVLVGKLERLGYIERFPSAEDNRVTWVRLTEKGQAFRPHAEEISVGLLEKGLQGIPDEELEQFRKTLKKIIANFD